MYLLPLLEVMGKWPNWLLNNMSEILMMVMKTKLRTSVEGFQGKRFHSVNRFANGWAVGSLLGRMFLLIVYPDKIGLCGLFQFHH
jgi:hypothetical protein